MKNFLILTAILTVLFVAVIDTKARIEELDDIAATTQVQVERSPVMDKSKGDGVNANFDNLKNTNPTEPNRPDVLPMQTSQDALSPRPQAKFNEKPKSPYMP